MTEPPIVPVLSLSSSILHVSNRIYSIQPSSSYIRALSVSFRLRPVRYAKTQKVIEVSVPSLRLVLSDMVVLDVSLSQFVQLLILDGNPPFVKRTPGTLYVSGEIKIGRWPMFVPPSLSGYVRASFNPSRALQCDISIHLPLEFGPCESTSLK